MCGAVVFSGVSVSTGDEDLFQQFNFEQEELFQTCLKKKGLIGM